MALTHVLSLFLATTLTSPESNTPREYLKNSYVRVTELHFDAATEQGKVEFIEITNLSKNLVDLSGWQVTGAGRLSLPKGTSLKPGKSLIVCKDLTAFRKTFGDKVTPVGAFPGKLKKKGETVRLEDPQGKVADEASYDSSIPGIQKAKGTGLSIHRVHISPASGTIWKAGPPTPGDPSRKKKE